MRQSMKLFLGAFLLATAVAWSQEPYHTLNPDLLVRLSYESGWPGQQICISVSQDGDYRIVVPGRVDTVRLHGKMSEDQLLSLKNMLTAPGFRSLSPNDASMIRNHAENFRAEIWRVEMPPAFKLLDAPAAQLRTPPAPPRQMHWLNADDENPFPAPIAKIVDWMQNFKPKNAKPLDSSFGDICPFVGYSLVQPSVATNKHP
jgi:hypothetical protein